MDSSCYSINVTIQNRAQQLQIYEISSLPHPHSNLSAQYKVNHKCIGITCVETKAVAITDMQYRTCQHATGQFCRIHEPFQPLTNLPSCVTTVYAKNNQAIKEQCSLVTSHMPHTYIPIAVNSNLWDNSLKPPDTRINNDNNLPRQGH